MDSDCIILNLELQVKFYSRVQVKANPQVCSVHWTGQTSSRSGGKNLKCTILNVGISFGSKVVNVSYETSSLRVTCSQKPPLSQFATFQSRQGVKLMGRPCHILVQNLFTAVPITTLVTNICLCRSPGPQKPFAGNSFAFEMVDGI